MKQKESTIEPVGAETIPTCPSSKGDGKREGTGAVGEGEEEGEVEGKGDEGDGRDTHLLLFL